MSVIRTVPLLRRDRRLRHHAVTEPLRDLGRTGDLVGADRARHRSGKDVKLARIGNVVEHGSRHAEVLGEHVRWRVLEPVAEEEGIVLVELAVVEHQQELGAIRAETLDRVGNTRGEIPEVADADIVDEVSPLRIDRGDSRRPIKHIGPLGGLVPMQLAHAAGIQTHVHAGDVLGDAKLAHRDLPGPAARREPHVGIIKRKAQVRQHAVIGRRRGDQIRVLTRTDGILRTGVGAAHAGAAGLRHRFAGLRADRGHRRRQGSGGGGCQHVATGDRIHGVLADVL